jgi:hypothetical protein
MTTLAVNTPRAFVIGDVNELPVIATDIIYEGAAVGVVVGTGHARPLTSADLFAGFAESKVDNSAGAAAALNVRVIKKGSAVLSVSGAVITDIGQPVYATDDNTFVFLPTGAVFIGIVQRFVSSGVVEVEFDIDKITDPYLGKVKETLAASTLTLDVQDNAKFIFVTVDSTVTLPATATGLRNCTIVCMGPFATVQITLTPSSGDKFMGPNFAPADNATCINTKATARRGDRITFDLGHADGACITEMVGIWA